MNVSFCLQLKYWSHWTKPIDQLTACDRTTDTGSSYHRSRQWVAPAGLQVTAGCCRMEPNGLEWQHESGRGRVENKELTSYFCLGRSVLNFWFSFILNLILKDVNKCQRHPFTSYIWHLTPQKSAHGWSVEAVCIYMLHSSKIDTCQMHRGTPQKFTWLTPI